MTKIRNVFANNMSTYIKLSKTQISKIIQSGRSSSSWLGNLGMKAIFLVSNLTSNAVNKFERKNNWKRSCESRKRIYFVYLK